MSSVYLSVYIASLFVSFVIVHVALYAKRERKIKRGWGGGTAGHTVKVDLSSAASALDSVPVCISIFFHFVFLS